MTDNRDPADLAAAYALNALSAQEKAEYERYLASSAEARTEADFVDDPAPARDVTRNAGE